MSPYYVQFTFTILKHLYGSSLMSNSWRSLRVSPFQLNLFNTFRNGQCWGWQETQDGCFAGAIGKRLFVLRQTDSDVVYRTLPASTIDSHDEIETLRNFFQLETDLQPLHERWCRGDSKSNRNMAVICKALPGMRVARQDPVECLFSFIVSSNNNITRIGNILGHWRRTYGEHLVTTDAASHSEVRPQGDPREDSIAYFAFPPLDRLAQCTKDDFYAKGTPYGTGYRATFLVNSAKKLTELGGREYLLKLREEKDPLRVRDALVKHFDGVGPKVADCVALFSLDQASVVPLDVHVLDIAKRDFGHTEMWQREKTKSLTTSRMAMISACFQESFGDYAGWAHSLLFAAELKPFEKYLPKSLVDEIQSFKAEKAAEKKAIKARKMAAKAAVVSPATGTSEGKDRKKVKVRRNGKATNNKGAKDRQEEDTSASSRRARKRARKSK